MRIVGNVMKQCRNEYLILNKKIVKDFHLFNDIALCTMRLLSFPY